MLVLVDAYLDPFGGTEGQVRALLANLPPGVEAELWVLQGSRWLRTNAFPVRVRDAGLPRLATPRGLVRLVALARRVRRGGFDLVHTFMNDASVVGPVVARLAGVPCVVSRRDLGFWQTTRGLVILRRTDRLAAALVANCDAVAAHTVRSEHVPPALVNVVPNGHDPARFGGRSGEARARLGIPADALLVGLLANVRPLKRHDDFLDAFARVANARRAVHALLIGEDLPGAEPLRARVERRGLTGRAHAVAPGGDVLPWLAALDVGVLCSETEGLSNAVLEYMAAGLPVVATAVGGTPELVEEGETGYLVEVGDVGALAERVGRLLGDADLRTRLGTAGRRRFEARFTVDRMVAGTRAVWEDAVGGRRGAPGPAWTVDTVEDRPGVEALADAWDALVGPHRLFAGPDWVLAWLETLGRDRAPHVLLARRPDGTLAGVLPLVRRRGVLALAGAGHGADHLDVVAAPDDAHAVTDVFLDALLRRPWRRVELRHLAEDGALRQRVRARRWALPFEERTSTTCPYLAAEGSFSSWVERSLSKATRRNVRRYPRRFRDVPGAAVTRVTDPAQAARAVDRIFALHETRFRRRRERSALLHPGVADFHRALARRLATRGRLQATFLEAEGRDVAGEYAFVHAGVMHAFQSGFDEDAPFESPGLVLQALVLEEDVFGGGLDEYDFLDGAEPYKRRWASGARRLFDVTLRRPTLSGRLTALARGVPRLAKDLSSPPAADG